MPDVLAIYGSSYGQAEKVTRRVAERLTNLGLKVTVMKGDTVPPALALDRYDGFVVAASVQGGRHQRYIEDFVRRNVGRLQATPSAFVSVSGSAGSPTPGSQAEARRYVDNFLELTGWRPSLTATVGGAVAYTRYGFVLRWTMWFINRRKGGPTDTSRDHETTDWVAVDHFAQEFAELIQPGHSQSMTPSLQPD